MSLRTKYYVCGIVLTMLIILSTVVSAEVVCENRNPAVPITTPTSDFVLHNDGTVTHTSTGLMWMHCSLGQRWDGASCIGSASGYTWADALQAAQNTQFAGYSDWRLPNRHELMSIVEESCSVPAINVAVFPNTQVFDFWTLSPSATLGGAAWYVSFNDGHLGNHYKDFLGRVRLVRTPQPTLDEELIAERYLPIEDGSVIRDITTNLEWQRCSVGQTWNATQQSCEGTFSEFIWDDAIQLTAPGGFRLPDITELRSLVYCSTGQPQEFGMDAHYTSCSGDFQFPTILTEAFPNTPSRGFWSASPYASHSDYAWYVAFGGGGVASNLKSANYAVRLVRGGQ